MLRGMRNDETHSNCFNKMLLCTERTRGYSICKIKIIATVIFPAGGEMQKSLYTNNNEAEYCLAPATRNEATSILSPWLDLAQRWKICPVLKQRNCQVWIVYDSFNTNVVSSYPFNSSQSCLTTFHFKALVTKRKLRATCKCTIFWKLSVNIAQNLIVFRDIYLQCHNLIDATYETTLSVKVLLFLQMIIQISIDWRPLGIPDSFVRKKFMQIFIRGKFKTMSLPGLDLSSFDRGRGVHYSKQRYLKDFQVWICLTCAKHHFTCKKQGFVDAIVHRQRRS